MDAVRCEMEGIEACAGIELEQLCTWSHVSEHLVASDGPHPGDDRVVGIDRIEYGCLLRECSCGVIDGAGWLHVSAVLCQA
jgi:hypothetical protein